MSFSLLMYFSFIEFIEIYCAMSREVRILSLFSFSQDDQGDLFSLKNDSSLQSLPFSAELITKAELLAEGTKRQ